MGHVMVRLVLNRATRRISTRLFYVVWTRTSAVTFVLWAAAFSVDDSRLAQTGLIFILFLLLASGILLLAIGIRDLIRDFRHFLHVRSHKNGRAPL